MFCYDECGIDRLYIVGTEALHNYSSAYEINSNTMGNVNLLKCIDGVLLMNT